MRAIPGILGLITVLLGVGCILFVCALASMTDPSLPSEQWWSVYLRKLIGPGRDGILIGVALIGCGFWVVVHNILKMMAGTGSKLVPRDSDLS